jgi:amidase
MERVSGSMEKSCVFDPAKKPVLRVREEERFVVETEDNISGMVRSERDLPTDERLRELLNVFPPRHNPLSGPVYVEGAKRGDTLEVSIEKIVVDAQGACCIYPGIGPLSDSKRWPELTEAYTKIIRHEPGPSGDTSDGRAVFGDGISWDLHPFIGTIGIPPDYELHSSVYGQGPSFGNWDCKDISQGSRLLLPCFHDGALLYMGDVHASQGDTEWIGTADEVRAEVTLSCRVLKNVHIPYARIIKDDAIVALCSDKPLEEAVKRAVVYLMEWMIDEYRVSPRDAYIVISANPHFRVHVYQMLQTPGLSYTVGAEYPKRFLGSG